MISKTNGLLTLFKYKFSYFAMVWPSLNKNSVTSHPYWAGNGGRARSDGDATTGTSRGRTPEDRGRRKEDGRRGRTPEDRGRRKEDGGRRREDRGRRKEDGRRGGEDEGRRRWEDQEKMASVPTFASQSTLPPRYWWCALIRHTARNSVADPDPNPDPDHQANIVRKPLNPTVLLLLFDFLSWKNVPPKK